MNKNRQEKGFSLIELMIVVVIIGILAAIAVPSYQEHLAKSRRADAQAALASVANALERNFTVTGRYDDDVNGNVVTILGLYGRTTVGDSGAYYNLSFNTTLGDDGTSTLARNAYTLHAHPTGSQTGDRCGVLSLTSTGARDAVEGGVSVDGCWR